MGGLGDGWTELVVIVGVVGLWSSSATGKIQGTGKNCGLLVNAHGRIESYFVPTSSSIWDTILVGLCSDVYSFTPAPMPGLSRIIGQCAIRLCKRTDSIATGVAVIRSIPNIRYPDTI